MRALAIGFVVLAACGRDPNPLVNHIGDAERGRELTSSYGCHTCHAIPGVIGANAHVGPPLTQFALRMYAGGQLNTVENLTAFLIDPRGVDPRTPMPSVGLDDRDARDIAAFLYTLR
jgi:cytochrome c2